MKFTEKELLFMGWALIYAQTHCERKVASNENSEDEEKFLLKLKEMGDDVRFKLFVNTDLGYSTTTITEE